jgi:hypothetical protein
MIFRHPTTRGILTGFCLLLLVAVAGAGNVEKEKAAVVAAERRGLPWWMEGKMGESWKEAAEYFRNPVKLEQWKQSLQAAREPLG